MISGSEPSVNQRFIALSRRVTVVNKSQQPVRVEAKRLLIDGAEWPVQQLFFRPLNSRNKDNAITVAGNAHDDHPLYVLVAAQNRPANQAGVIEFQIDGRDEPLLVDVQFP